MMEARVTEVFAVAAVREVIFLFVFKLGSTYLASVDLSKGVNRVPNVSGDS